MDKIRLCEMLSIVTLYAFVTNVYFIDCDFSAIDKRSQYMTRFI